MLLRFVGEHHRRRIHHVPTLHESRDRCFVANERGDGFDA